MSLSRRPFLLSTASFTLIAMYPKAGMSCEATFARDHLTTMLTAAAIVTGIGLGTGQAPIVVAGVAIAGISLSIVGVQTLVCTKLP